MVFAKSKPNECNKEFMIHLPHMYDHPTIWAIQQNIFVFMPRIEYISYFYTSHEGANYLIEYQDIT